MSMQNSGEALTPERAAQEIARAEARGLPGRQAQVKPEEGADEQTVRGLPYGTLRQHNPEYDGDFWRKCKALYAGGKKLLNDDDLMKEIFPKHRDEHDDVYAERKKRAFYVPYAGEIIDHIVAALVAQPITMTTEGEGEDAWPDFYDGFYKDTSAPNGKELSFNQLLKEQVTNALQCKRTWALVDMPPQLRDEAGELLFKDRAAQEDAGALNAWVVPLEPMHVIDWEMDDSGELLWAMVHMFESKRYDIGMARGVITERFVYYTPTYWQMFEIRYTKDKPPKAETLVPLIDEGTHSFGRVQLIPLEVPDGLWAMAKLEGLAREHLNKRSALAWAEYQSLFQELYEYLAPEDPMSGDVSEAGEDPARAVNQSRGQGFVQVRGGEDKAEFVGPDTTPFQHAIESCNNIRDEMHRVTHQMALSVDNSAAALGRSGESKAQDKAATAVILTALGKIIREFAEKLYNTLAHARGDAEVEGEWSAQGADKFDTVQVGDAIDEGLTLKEIDIPSSTFKKRYFFALAKLILGDNATPDDIEAIEKELEKNITDDDNNKVDLQTVMALMAAGGEPGDKDDDDDDDLDDDDPNKMRGNVTGDGPK